MLAAVSPAVEKQQRDTHQQHPQSSYCRADQQRHSVETWKVPTNHFIRQSNPGGAEHTEEKLSIKATLQTFLYLAEFHWRSRWTQQYQSPASWCWRRRETACVRPGGTRWWRSSCSGLPGELPGSGCQQSDWQALRLTPKPGREGGSPGCHRNIGPEIKSWCSGRKAGSLEQLRQRMKSPICTCSIKLPGKIKGLQFNKMIN